VIFIPSALARYDSGREQALKFSNKHLSNEPSSSLHLSLGNPVNVTGRELLEQKVTVLSKVRDCNVDGSANL
jgi:hypothetical protein